MLKQLENRMRSRSRGALLLEVIIAVAIFALAMVTMSVMFFAVLSDTQNEYEPYLERTQLEALCRALDRDFQTYKPIFAYEGELRYNGDWVTPGRYDLIDNTYPYELNQDNFQSRTDPNMTLPPNTASRKAYTLVFLGTNAQKDLSLVTPNYYINMEVVYHLIAKDDPSGDPERIVYQVQRIHRKDGVTENVTFFAEGYSLSDEDQTLPEFVLQRDNLIRTVMPNPLSSRVQKMVGTNTNAVYYTMLLKYYLNNAGL